MVSGSDRYRGEQYLESNPDWHTADSPWKAEQVLLALDGWRPQTVCEVGCGAGEILRLLHERWGTRRAVGYDIAPAAIEMARAREAGRLVFKLEDAAASSERFDLMLLMDVIEHVEDPLGLLRALRFKSARVVLHIPLDLSVQSVLRPRRLLRTREVLGHLHYYTRETALATLQDAGYRIVSVHYTAGGVDRPAQSWKARAVRQPRRLLQASVAARTLGGFSVLVVADTGSGAVEVEVAPR